MRKIYFQIMKSFFTGHIKAARKAHKLSQAKMAEKLIMEPRSYTYLEHGVNAMSALTLLIYLHEFCPDPKATLDELWDRFDKANRNP